MVYYLRIARTALHLQHCKNEASRLPKLKNVVSENYTVVLDTLLKSILETNWRPSHACYKRRHKTVQLRSRCRQRACSTIFASHLHQTDRMLNVRR